MLRKNVIEEIPGEVWKEVEYGKDNYTNKLKIEVSNLGRVRTYTKIAEGNLLEGTLQQGFKVVKFKFFTPRTDQVRLKLREMKDELIAKRKEYKELTKIRRRKKAILEQQKNKKVAEKMLFEIDKLNRRYRKEYRADELKRTSNVTYLVHRLVADAFVPRPSEAHTVVIHRDKNILNNNASNLEWLRPEDAREYVLAGAADIDVVKKRRGRKPAIPRFE
jgi:hypothetical protein